MNSRRGCFPKTGCLLLVTVLFLSAAFWYQDRPDSRAHAVALEALQERGIDPEQAKCLAVIDFDKPSFLRRMAIYCGGEVNQYLVSHGRNSGGLFARTFSNRSGSYQSSLGLYRVGASYRGKHGLSRRLHGLEKGKNDRALQRAIVIHGADYVNYPFILRNLVSGAGPRIGRSLGCPAVSRGQVEEVLGSLTEGTYLYIYSSRSD